MLVNIHESSRAISIYSGGVMTLRLNANTNVERLSASILISDRRHNKVLIKTPEIRNFAISVEHFLNTNQPDPSPNGVKLDFLRHAENANMLVKLSFNRNSVTLGGDSDFRLVLRKILEGIYLWKPFIEQWVNRGIIDHDELKETDKELLYDPVTRGFIQILHHQGHFNTPAPTITVRKNAFLKHQLLIANSTVFMMQLEGDINRRMVSKFIELVKSEPDDVDRIGFTKELYNKYLLTGSIFKLKTRGDEVKYHLTIMSEIGPTPQAVRLVFGTKEERDLIANTLELALNI